MFANTFKNSKKEDEAEFYEHTKEIPLAAIWDNTIAKFCVCHKSHCFLDLALNQI